MKIAIASFTMRGAALAEQIAERISSAQENLLEIPEENGLQIHESFQIHGGGEKRSESLSQWTGRMFVETQGIIFIGATGIAVRSIAPYLKDKFSDPAVVVLDEAGDYCISLLSGHVGGANELCQRIAALADSIPVITTATDVNHLFAVDVFAAKNHLCLTDRQMAKTIAARILQHRPVYLLDEEDKLGIRNQKEARTIWAQRGVTVISGTEAIQNLSESQKKEAAVYLGIHEQKIFAEQLDLIPATVTVGIGCRKDVSTEQIRAAVEQCLEQNKIHPAAVEQFASVDIKKDEPGLLEFAGTRGREIHFFSSEELSVIGDVSEESEFVRQVTGVGNICERSARLASGAGTLISPKQAVNGVTTALAEREWSIEYE